VLKCRVDSRNLRAAPVPAVSFSPHQIEQLLIPQVAALRQQALAMEPAHEDQLGSIHPDWQDSARNLLHYLALRRSDIPELQELLVQLGLSRLGSVEVHVLASIDALLLEEHGRRLLGHPSGKRSSRIMVTMPSEAAKDPKLIEDLLTAGMDVMRINCAHDGPEQWLNMIRYLRQAERRHGRNCKVCADLAGPKLRTGAIAPYGSRIECKPERDPCGRVVAPAQLWLTDAAAPVPPPAARRPPPAAVVSRTRAAGSQNWINTFTCNKGARPSCCDRT